MLIDRHKTPGVHAIVIGVGKYALTDGQPDDWGFQDLKSPVSSAVAFLKWLRTDYDASTRLSSTNALASPPADAGPLPLSSIDVYLSDPVVNPTLLDENGNAFIPQRATIQNVETGVQQWIDRCSQHERNLALFYFCGHGLERGDYQSLLLENFGKNKFDVMSDAIDFRNFHQGMEQCRARKQWYLIDACRATPTRLLSITGAGHPIIAPDLSKIPSELDEREPPIFNSAAPGREAFGGPDISRFTQALLRALRGCAWDDSQDRWVKWSVGIDNLIVPINQLLKLEEKIYNKPRQRAFCEKLALGFTVYEAPPNTSPTVPVLLSCTPPVTLNNVKVLQNGNVVWPSAQGGPQNPGNLAIFDLPASDAYHLSLDVPPAPVLKPLCVRPALLDMTVP